MSATQHRVIVFSTPSVAIGDDPGAIRVAVGDRVLFPRYTGTEIRPRGEDHLLIESSDVLVIRHEAAAFAAA